MCWSFNNKDDIEVIANPKGFRFGNLEYLLVEIPSNADNAATWCRENVNGTLPVPDTEWEFNVSLFNISKSINDDLMIIHDCQRSFGKVTFSQVSLSTR